jgi:periplasmic divalent cation tolerance protein
VKEADYIVVLIATDSEEEARRIGQLLVDHEKAACASIVPRVNSLFRWEGQLESAQESLMLVKTKASLFPEVAELVKTVHSYEVPEIVALPIIAGSEEYLKWLDITCR